MSDQINQLTKITDIASDDQLPIWDTSNADTRRVPFDVFATRIIAEVPTSELAQAWAESSTPPDPLDADSKSAKTWAGIAENYAGFLESFVVPTWGTFTTDSSLSNGRGPYALPYDPVDVRCVALTVGGIPQVPTTDFTLTYAGAVAQILLAFDMPSGTVCNYCIQRPLQADPNAPAITLSPSGGDDGPLIQAALVAASGREVRGTPGSVFRTASTVSVSVTAPPFLRDLNILAEHNGLALDILVDPAGPYALSADYTAGSTTLPVAAMAVVPSAGAKIKIVSNAVDPANRNEAASSKYRTGEWAVVGEGSTTTSIVLAHPLAITEGLTDDLLTRGNPYTTAFNARVLVLQDVAVDLSGLSISYPEGEAWTATAVRITGANLARIKAPKFGKVYGSALALRGCYGPQLDGSSVGDVTTYGIASSSYGLRSFGANLGQSRHGITSTAGTAALDATDKGSLLSLGRTVGQIMIGAIAHGSGAEAPFDTHQDQDDSLFVGCISDGCTANEAIALRGRGNRHVSPLVRNATGGGALIFTEASSGDGTSWTSGLLPQDITRGEIVSPQFDVGHFVFNTNFAFGRLSGPGNHRTKSQRAFTSNGGVMTIAGPQRVVAAGAGADNEACITCTNAIAALLTAIPEARIDVEAPVEIDARSITAVGVMGVEVESASVLRVAAPVLLRLPSTATRLLSDAGTITVEGDGFIRFSVEGAADNSITLGLALRDNLRVQSLDGTVDYDTTFRDLRQLASLPAVGVSHSGTGAEVQNVYVPPHGYEPWRVLNARGVGQYLCRITGSKTGAVGDAIISARSGTTNFISNSTIAAAANRFEIDFAIWITAADAQLNLITLRTFTDTGTASTQFQRRNAETEVINAGDQILRIGVNSAVGDTINIHTCEVWATAKAVL